MKDSTGQKLAYVYFEDERFRSAAKLLTKDEARRIAADDAVSEREDLQLPIRCRRNGGKLVVPPDDSNGSDVEALLDQGGGQEAVAE